MKDIVSLERMLEKLYEWVITRGVNVFFGIIFLSIGWKVINKTLTGQNAKDALKLIPKRKELSEYNIRIAGNGRTEQDFIRYAQLSREVNDEIVRIINKYYLKQ